MNRLHIKNFKNLEDLQIDKLGRVNLIAGENNVGKSSLLEAISIFQSGGSLEWLKQLLVFRGESVDSGVENRIQKEMESFLSFIPNYDDSHKFDIPILLSDGVQQVMIRFVHLTETTVTENGFERVVRTVIEDYDPANYYDNLGFGLEVVSSSGKVLYIFHGVVSRSQIESTKVMQYVRMGDLNISKNPSLFDRLALTPLQTEVVKALQIIEPGIIDLNFLKDDRRRDRMTRDDERAPYIALEGEVKPRRLSSMGDGINRVLTIILAMLNARDGILLIDEFENGLGVNCIDVLAELLLGERRDLQFVITSHHPKIINQISNKKWKIIERDIATVKNFTAEEYGIMHSQHDAYFNLINRWEFEGKI